MLFTIANRVRARLEAQDRAAWERAIESKLQLRGPCLGFRQALVGDGEHFIFEIKRTSPRSRGTTILLDVATTARSLQDHGTSAISVLTESDYFGGSLSDLDTARQSVSLPLLRKDFIVDKLQIAEAKAFGADAVLLIAALLPDGLLREFVACAFSLGIDALVEIHDESELGHVVDSGATIIGVNNRNLHAMTIDLPAGARLLQLVPDHCVRVAESGLASRADVIMMRDAGANAFLIGSAIMRAPDMTAAIKELIGHD